MDQIRAAIVEDDRNHAGVLQDYLLRYGQERGMEILAELFSSGLDFVSDYVPRFDVVFMDIDMPHMNGMDCAFKLREMDWDVPIVFVTSMVQYAVKGYEVEALGYMVKPVEYYSFSVLMDKVCMRQSERGEKRLCVGSGDRMRRIPLRNLYYVEVLDHYLIYHVAGGEELRLIGKMKEVEDALAGKNFFRCSNCYLVNLSHVLGIDGNEITVGKDKIQISRRRKKEFLIALHSYLNGGGRGNG